MRSCTTRTLHVSRAIAIPGYAAQVSVRAGSVIAHLASLNRDGPKQTLVQSAANVCSEPTLPIFCNAVNVLCGRLLRQDGSGKEAELAIGGCSGILVPGRHRS